MMVRELAECNLHLRSLKSYPELQVGIGGFLKWGIPKTRGHIRFQYSNLNLNLGVPRFQEPHELIIFKIILLEVGILLVSIWFLAGSGKIFCPARTCQEKTPECPGRSSGGVVQIPCPQTNGRTIDVNKFPLSSASTQCIFNPCPPHTVYSHEPSHAKKDCDEWKRMEQTVSAFELFQQDSDRCRFCMVISCYIQYRIID